MCEEDGRFVVRGVSRLKRALALLDLGLGVQVPGLGQRAWALVCRFWGLGLGGFRVACVQKRPY